MKKDLAIHFVFAAALFILFSVYRDWLNLSFVPFWLGAILGTLLPDVDYLIYVYALKPKEAASQEVASLISQRKVVKTWDTLMTSFSERKGLLVHTASFQALFLVFSVWMITSGSLMGMGLVLAFMLHLIMDQVTDLVETGTIDNWFTGFPVNLTSEQRRWFLVANVLVLLFLGFFF
jgi:hypothetical protein